jgi:heat shock protein HslJ
MKKIFILIVLIAGIFFLVQNDKKNKEITPEVKGFDVGENAAIFGEPVLGDLDADGDEDQALYVVEQPGGSGSFYYAVLAINNNQEYKLTEKMFLGDRIAPQNIQIVDGRAVYNFADRKAGEPMSTPASVAKSVWVHYDKNTNEIGEWVKDFEGEANPDVLKIDIKKWIWQTATIDDKEVKPKDSSKFTIEFKKDGTFGASTDCNGIGGNYSTKDKKIYFTEMMGTLMYCEGSQEDVFKGILENAESYSFTSKGELRFELKNSKGVAIFN